MEIVAWGCALAAVLLGALGACIPGFPGSAVALLGLVAFAGMTDFEIVTPAALLLGAGIALAGLLAQFAGPVVMSRAFRGTAGVATGAALGAVCGALVPLPGASWVGAMAGACVLGVVGARQEKVATIRGLTGTASGCVFAALVDLIAVLGIAAVLALSDFIALLAG